MTKHTPGPWPIQSHENRLYVGPVEIDGDDDEDLANARLIAAAPDMLAALRALDDVNLDVGGVRLREIVDAAIDKAEGEEE